MYKTGLSSKENLMDVMDRRVNVAQAQLDDFKDVLNKNFHQAGNDSLGMFKVFFSEYLLPNKVEVIDMFMVLGQPLLLINQNTKKMLIALDADYDIPREDMDKEMQKFFLEKVKDFAISKGAEAYVAKFGFTRGKDKKTYGDEPYSWIIYKGISKIN
jgi:hypothetical protein